MLAILSSYTASGFSHTIVLFVVGLNFSFLFIIRLALGIKLIVSNTTNNTYRFA